MLDLKRRFDWLGAKIYLIMRAHILNPLWWPRSRRHDRRSDTLARSLPWYFKRNYLRGLDSVPEGPVLRDDAADRIYTIWFQGEENAPALVKACFASIRRHCRQKLVVLDTAMLKEMLDIPQLIWKKYEEGKIGRANFSDVCRIDLLYKFGGYWFDSTCFVTEAIPGWVEKEDFFLFMTEKLYGSPYSFIQSCFIRARKGDYLLAAWRKIVFDYWERQNHHMDYFHVHLMFKALVENDERAREHFSRMPKVGQDATHILGCAYGIDQPYDELQFRKDTAGAFFQKLTYRGADTAPEGSIIDYIKGTAD